MIVELVGYWKYLKLRILTLACSKTTKSGFSVHIFQQDETITAVATVPHVVTPAHSLISRRPDSRWRGSSPISLLRNVLLGAPCRQRRTARTPLAVNHLPSTTVLTAGRAVGPGNALQLTFTARSPTHS